MFENLLFCLDFNANISSTGIKKDINANIITSQIFHEIKYDLRGHMATYML